MVVLSKGRKPDKFESHNFLTLSFTNIRGLRSSFVEFTSFLELNSPDILALCETNLDDSFREFPCDRGGSCSETENQGVTTVNILTYGYLIVFH